MVGFDSFALRQPQRLPARRLTFVLWPLMDLYAVKGGNYIHRPRMRRMIIRSRRTDQSIISEDCTSNRTDHVTDPTEPVHLMNNPLMRTPTYPTVALSSPLHSEVVSHHHQAIQDSRAPSCQGSRHMHFDHEGFGITAHLSLHQPVGVVLYSHRIGSSNGL